MSKLLPFFGLLTVLGIAPTFAGVYPDAAPANQGESSVRGLRTITLGDLRFSDHALYNLYDQGGSPMGLLETHAEHLRVGLGMLSSSRASSGDSLSIGHQDYFLPQVGFFQPGVFAAILYYQRQVDSYQSSTSDTLDMTKSIFGFDLAAGPASGLFRIGFGGHAFMGGMEYPGTDSRVLVGVPSLRLDVGSRPVHDVELGAYLAASGRFDSLKNATGRLERVAVMSVPRFGFLADIDSLRELPLSGNAALEFGTDRQLGEYRQVGQAGVVYPTVLTSNWNFQTQWLYAIQWEEYRIQPSFRFAHRSEKSQGYIGIQANQNPFKKGDKINGLDWTHSINDFGLGGRLGYEELADLFLEWENSGHTYSSDSTVKRSYTRYSIGAESHLEKAEALKFPEGISLALRAGWSFRQDAGEYPGYADDQFSPFVPTSQASGRGGFTAPKPGNPQGYSSFHLGFGFGLMENRLNLDGMLSFPSQKESLLRSTRTQEAKGMEFGLNATYRML